MLGWQADTPDRYCDRCGASIGPHETDEFGCLACRGRRLVWDRVVRVGEYHGGLAALVKDAKFHARRSTARGLGRHLGRALRAAGAATHRVCVVPVPMWIGRRIARRIDHAAEIAAAVGAELPGPVVHALSARHRPSQRSVPASHRPGNVRGVFRPRRGIDLTGWRVVLIDDVMTSGATARQAARALTTIGARDLWMGVVAVTPGPDRRAGPPVRGTLAPVAGPRGVETTDPPLDTPGNVGTVAALASGDDRTPVGVSIAPHTTL